MKFLVCLALVAVIAAVSATNSTWGARNWNDQVLTRQNVIVKGNQWNPNPKFNLTYPVKGQTNFKTITFIFARDLNRMGNGGRASIYHGGVGHRNVTMLFNAQASTGLNMTVEVWGR